MLGMRTSSIYSSAAPTRVRSGRRFYDGKISRSRHLDRMRSRDGHKTITKGNYQKLKSFESHLQPVFTTSGRRGTIGFFRRRIELWRSN
uniref:Putative ovule protein n=1 Tax=Solanum chacoense TaxID=4108 RepID=A0A0V0H5A6_SOLCH